jgi:DNA-binding NarL/FixJ family response regulator
MFVPVRRGDALDPERHDRAASNSGPAAKTTLLVDDHHAFADLMAMALGNEPDFHIVGIAPSATAAVEMATRHRPEMIVMDVELGSENGIEATRRICRELPDTVIVIVSAHCDPATVARAASAGASAFAPKSGSLSELLTVLRSARLGSMLVAPSLRRQAADGSADASGSVDVLTKRECEVLALMSVGAAPTQIARILNISVNTCRGYVKQIHAKLGVRSQLEAVVTAQRLGLIPPNQ